MQTSLRYTFRCEMSSPSWHEQVHFVLAFASGQEGRAVRIGDAEQTQDRVMPNA